MEFEAKHKNYGVVKVANDGFLIRVYSDSTSYYPININGGGAVSAHWAGDCIIVELSNGQTRRYYSFSGFNTI